MKLAFFASHGGSNMQAVIDAIHAGRLTATAALVISNNGKSTAVSRARLEGIPCRVLNSHTHPDPAELDQAMLDELLAHGVELIVLAGYMKMIGPQLLDSYENRIVNIHPSLLPKFGGHGMFGQHVHRAVLAAGETVTGVSIHLVNSHYDEGRLLAQAEVPVQTGDTVETLAARVLEREHSFLVETLGRCISGEIVL